jgi:hypothetical protein
MSRGISLGAADRLARIVDIIARVETDKLEVG